MEHCQITPSAEDLDRMPYSELKKLAKERGIKGNLKAGKIIAAILRTSRDSDDSFSTPAQKLINSSRKNKEDKFNKDMLTPLATPRRGTYSLGSPVILKVEEEKQMEMPLCSEKSAEVDSLSADAVSLSSDRKLRPRKVSFLSPIVTPRAQRRNSSLKSRPKTPVPSRDSCTPVKRRSSAHLTPRARNLRRTSAMDSLNGETPLPQIEEENAKKQNDGGRTSAVDSLNGETPLPQIEEENAKFPQKDGDEIKESVDKTLSSTLPEIMEVKKLPQSDVHPSGSKISAASKANVSLKKKPVATPSSKIPAASKANVSLKKKPVATPSSRSSAKGKENVSLKKRLLATPNFKKIHEKAFEKMESIDDYQKRKMDSAKKTLGDSRFRITKAKSKIPSCSGIPFIPSYRPNLKKPANPVAEHKKDTPKMVQKKKGKFDLKASLSRKLGYTPYTGPLKPLLVESKQLSSAPCEHNSKQPENPVLKNKRAQNRAALKGVRTNKRFELQMKNRKLQ